MYRRSATSDSVKHLPCMIHEAKRKFRKYLYAQA